MSDKLLECPFCGGKAEFTVTGDRYPFRVCCTFCGALAGGTSFENDDFNAYKWNSRANKPEPPK